MELLFSPVGWHNTFEQLPPRSSLIIVECNGDHTLTWTFHTHEIIFLTLDQTLLNKIIEMWLGTDFWSPSF